jgi:hypothetical protein
MQAYLPFILAAVSIPSLGPRLTNSTTWSRPHYLLGLQGIFSISTKTPAGLVWLYWMLTSFVLGWSRFAMDLGTGRCQIGYHENGIEGRKNDVEKKKAGMARMFLKYRNFGTNVGRHVCGPQERPK